MELTNEEIAHDLFLSLETIRSHRKNIMVKLNAINTAGMIRKAYEQGILQISAALQ